MRDTEHAESMKEWETLRQETFQSQNQRFIAFQVSMTLFAALYVAYLSPATTLQREPLLFQSFLLLLLLPFVVLIRRLRKRDYYQACYIGDFIRPLLPTVRYTLRNRGVGRKLRDPTSSTEAMKLTYLLVGVLTSVITPGLPLISSADPYLCAAQRLGAADFGWSFLLRAGLLAASLFVYLYVVGSSRAERRWQDAVFAEFRHVAVRELLHGSLRPAGFEGHRLDHPMTWDGLYGSESQDTKLVTIAALRQNLTDYPGLKNTVDQLAELWNLATDA